LITALAHGASVGGKSKNPRRNDMAERLFNNYFFCTQITLISQNLTENLKKSVFPRAIRQIRVQKICSAKIKKTKTTY